MLKLHLKLLLYNTLTKGTIILVLGLLLIIFIDDISTNQLDNRLSDKVNNFITHISDNEISDNLSTRKKFIDFNVLKEEYIVLTEIPDSFHTQTTPTFYSHVRTVGDESSTYRIITQNFNYNDKTYQVEIGLSLVNATRLKKTIYKVIIIAVLLTLGISLLLDTVFNRILFIPFYKIVEQKIKNVNDPILYDQKLIPTTTKDFRTLDENIGNLMNKINDLIAKEKQFIANVSHELLTPISILIVRLENMLQDEKLHPNHVQKTYASIKTLYRLKSVVNSLLLISRIENQQFSKPDEIHFLPMINEVIEELEDRCVDKEISIATNIKHNFYIDGNSSLMHTLFFNIINNAIKYNKQKGSVTIKDKTSNEFYSIYVIDTGLGMDTENISLAFNRFEQLNSDQTDSHGLGLAIVKSIALFHKIDIEIDSEIGKGCTFILRFRNTELKNYKTA